jgi:hypothetical protein
VAYWRLRLAFYEHTGTLQHQNFIPHIAMPVRDRQLAARDLFTWLVCSMRIVAGPTYNRKKTCVAALVMQDNPAVLREQRYHPFQSHDDPQKAQGGLYCIDMHGNIVSYNPSLRGLYTSLCSLHDRVIGVTFDDGQWQLWCWYPFQEGEHVLCGFLSPDVRRATILTKECGENEILSWFWCVEEYEDGIRVTQRSCDTFQEKQSVRIEGMFLPDNWVRAGSVDRQPKGLVAYRDCLLILGVNQEKVLQLLQVQAD